MIIVDRALEERERQQNPIRVALVGAGFMGRGIVLQITSAVPGMEVVAIYNRNLEGAARAFKDAGIDEFSYICDSHALEDHIARRGVAITDDPDVICEAENIDAIIFKSSCHKLPCQPGKGPSQRRTRKPEHDEGGGGQ